MGRRYDRYYAFFDVFISFRMEKEGKAKQRVHFLNTFFFKQLYDEKRAVIQYDRVMRWLRKVYFPLYVSSCRCDSNAAEGAAISSFRGMF